jgi:hypothetical protein
LLFSAFGGEVSSVIEGYFTIIINRELECTTDEYIYAECWNLPQEEFFFNLAELEFSTEE